MRTPSKIKSDRLSDVNAGLFDYPVLMACDILMYDANIVPVGRDQKQHLEMTRDIAQKFNAEYGETLVIPEAQIHKDVMVVPGVDGQKMSKSYGNFIDVFLPEKQLKKQVMSIVTDSAPLEEPKDPENSLPYILYKLVASAQKSEIMRQNYLAGGYGYGHAKKDLLNAILERFADARDRYQHLMAHTDEIEEELSSGAERARLIGNEVLQRMRENLV